LPDGPLPITPAAAAQQLNEFDRTMIREMQDRGAVGGALAVTRLGKLVHARGFGYADLEKKEPVQPTSLLRIGSISKTFTAVAVLQLVQRRKLGLDANVTDVLTLEPVLAAGREPDPRMRQVTIRHLLNHSGGWDRDVSFDPMNLEPRAKAAKSAGVTEKEVRPEHIVRYMLGQPLDFDPGAKYAYSNFGYCVLGLDDVGRPKRNCYGFGWYLSLGPKGPTVYHGGSLRGTCAGLYRRPDGLNFAFLLNVRKREEDASLSAALQKTADRLQGPLGR